MKTVDAYTNLELSDDVEEDYDILCEAQILELVIDTFKKEYDDVNVLLQMKCDYILSGNSMEAKVGKFLDELSDKADIVINTLSDKIDGFDISKLKINKQYLNKLLEFLMKYQIELRN